MLLTNEGPLCPALPLSTVLPTDTDFTNVFVVCQLLGAAFKCRLVHGDLVGKWFNVWPSFAMKFRL